MSTPDIQGIACYILIDGKICLAPIDRGRVEAFIGMLPAFQEDPTSRAAKMLYLPESVTCHVEAAGRAIAEVFAQAKKGK